MQRQGRYSPLGALGTVAALLLFLFLVAQGEKQISEEGAGAGTRGKELEDRSRGIVPAQEEKEDGESRRKAGQAEAGSSWGNWGWHSQGHSLQAEEFSHLQAEAQDKHLA